MAGAGIDDDVAGVGIDALDGRRDDFILLGLVFLDHHAALRLTDALNDDLLCRLRGNASECLGLQLSLADIADVQALGVRVCLLQRHLRQRIDNLFHDVLLLVYADFLLVLVDGNADIGAAALTLECGNQRRLNLTDHIFLRDAFFLFEKVQCLEKFLVHFLMIPPDRFL